MVLRGTIGGIKGESRSLDCSSVVPNVLISSLVVFYKSFTQRQWTMNLVHPDNP